MKSKHLGKQLLFGLAILSPGAMATSSLAQVSIGVGISLPPPIVFAAAPQVVVLPGFDIYVAPDIAEEVYFVDGYWWRPWQGHWYRSQSYDNGWSYYSNTPSFYRNVRRDWRNDYSNHRWEGQQWNYERVPYQRAQQNWSSWKSTNYWRSQDNWGRPGMKADHHGNVAASPQHRESQAVAPRSEHYSSQPQHSTPASQHYNAPAQAERAPHHSAPQGAHSQQHGGSPKGASQQHGGGQPQAHEQNSKQPKGGGGGQGHGDGGQGNSQPASQHGGGNGGGNGNGNGGGNGKH
jgi:hypothetical protein